MGRLLPQLLLLLGAATSGVCNGGSGDGGACLAQPIVNGSRAGGDYANHPIHPSPPNGTRGAELCRASCCADPACIAWGLDVAMPTAGKVMNCSQGDMCCWLKGTYKGGSGTVSHCGRPAGCFTGTSGRSPAPPPAPAPPPPPGPSFPSIETECMLRQLALDYAIHLQPQRNHQHTHNALRLSAGCNRTFVPPKAARPSTTSVQDQRTASIVVHVSVNGSDTGAADGSLAQPFATLHRARDAVRARRSSVLPASLPADVVIGGGTYHLGATLELGVPDSHIRFVAAPGETVVLSGAEPLVTSWKPAGSPFPPNVVVTNVGAGKVSPRGSAGLTSLFVNGERRWRARTPNGDPRSDFTPKNMYEGPAATPQTNQLSEDQIKGIKPMPVRSTRKLLVSVKTFFRQFWVYF
jgi:hypothetical protein